jgi:hypothetical protein
MFSEARMGRVTEIEKAGALVDQIAASVIRNQHALVALSRLKNADATLICTRWRCAR